MGDKPNDKPKKEYAPWKSDVTIPPKAPAPHAEPAAPAPAAPEAAPSWPPTDIPAKPAAKPKAAPPATSWPPTEAPAAPPKPAPPQKSSKPAAGKDDARLSQLFANNQAWSKRMTTQDPAFFQRLAAVQTPKFLWIGCSDSRVPANEIVDMLPGEMFVHRNVANLVVHTDLNCLAVIQFAVEVLKVQHIIVCGHYNCGGVRAVIAKQELGLADNWLRHLADIEEKFETALAALKSDEERIKNLCELNVVEQVLHVAETTIVKNAWKKKQPLSIHGWVYGLEDGLLRDLLENPVSSPAEVTPLARLLIGPGKRA